MDLTVCGIIDIVLLVLLLIVWIIGYKKGFIAKALSLVGFILAFYLAYNFCTNLTNFLKENDVLYPEIFNPILHNIESSGVFVNPNATLKEVLISLDVPEILAGAISILIKDYVDVSNLASGTAESLTIFIMNIISFLVIFIGIILVSVILKLLSKVLRTNSVIRFIDGVAGMALYTLILIIFVYAAFTLIRYCYDAEWFSVIREFLIVDMQLDNPEVFRLSKYIYEHNFVYNLIEVLL